MGTAERPLLLAEELLLLLLDDDTGSLITDQTRADCVLAGGVLLELVLAEQVHLTGEAGFLRRRHVEVAAGPGPQLDDPVLARAFAQIARKERPAGHLVQALGKGLRGELLDRLVAREVLRHEQGRVLGIFPTHRWPALDRSHEAVTRKRLRDVLVGGAQPDLRTAALVALLSAVDQAHTVVGDLDRPAARAVQRRAKQLAEGEWVPQAVRQAVQAVRAGVAAAAVAASTAATVAST